MRAFSRLAALLAVVLSALALPLAPAHANGTSHALAGGAFAQSWTNTGLITTDDDWSGVPSLIGYSGDGLISGDGVDPQTVLADGSAVEDVTANRTQPNTFTTGGVAEFELANPTVALQGSSTADAPHLVLHLNTINRQNIVVGYTLRDIDGSADNAQQQVALQFRAGNSGNFTNVPAGYVNDATSGPSLATQVTPVSAQLPAAADNQPLVQVRIITTNANGTDEWVGVDDIAVNGAPFTGESAPTVSATIPAAGATGIAPNAAISVTFSEPVNTTGDWFTISCATSGAHGAAASGGPASFTLAPVQPFAPGETCGVTIHAALVSDQDITDPPDTMAADVSWSFTVVAAGGQCINTDTPINAVQGSGATAAASGVVTVQGLVVGDYEGASPNLRGFYLQELAQVDANPATSEGIFVFNGADDDVSLGRVVQVTGTVGEFQGQTQLSGVTALEDCGSTAGVTPADITLPLPAAEGGVEYLERFEGMLVRLPQTLAVSEHFQLARFGQVTLSSGGRLRQPTNVAAPGAPALAVQAANDRNQIILDDADNSQNPASIVFGRAGNPLSAANTLRGGDTATGIVGVLTYTWAGNTASGNAFRVRPVNALGGGAPNFQAANPRPATPPEVGGTLHVASANLLNYFNTFGASTCTNGVGGAATECRGADNQAEFDRQWPKTVAVLSGLGADIIGVNELENDGYGTSSAIRDLVTKLNAATAPDTYAFIDADARTGQTNALGTDAIRVALIYKPAVVTPVGATGVLNTGAFGQYTLMGGGTIGRNRPALAQTFQDVAGHRLTVVVGHLKSKGSSCADNLSPVGPDSDTGDGQGNCKLTRTKAAQELAAWLATDPTGSGDPDFLIVGDMNSYAKEDPISAFVAAGYTDMIARRSGPESYSYAFDGQWGYLDHALASASLRGQISGAAEWHINADEPAALDYNTNFKTPAQQASLYAPDRFRTSDHDPVLVGIGFDQFFESIVYLPVVGR